MLDNCTFKMQVKNPGLLLGNSSLRWQNITDLNSSKTHTSQGRLSGHSDSKIFLRFNHRLQELTFKNSLPKFIKGENHSRFTFSENAIAIDNLSEALGLDVWEAKVDKFEFGLNLVVEDSPDTFLKEISMYDARGICRLDSFQKRNTLKRPYTNYAFKVYNKTLQAQLPYNSIRVEIQREKPTRYLPNISFVKDLVNKKQFQKLGSEIIKELEKLHFYAQPNLLGDSPKPNDIKAAFIVWGNHQPDFRQQLAKYCSKRTVEYQMKKIVETEKKIELLKNPAKKHLISIARLEIEQIIHS